MAGNKNSGSKPGIKRTRAVRDNVIKEGAAWLYENPTAARGAFVQWIKEVHGYESRGEAYKIRKLCYEKVAELQDKHIESKRTLRVQALERLFHQAQKEEDIKAQLAVLQELNKVDNLYVQKVETTDKKDADIFKINLDDDNKLRKVD